MAYGVAPAQSWRQAQVGNCAAIGAGAIPASALSMDGRLALTIPDGATGDLDFTALPYKIRVIDAIVVTTADPGANVNTMQLQTAGGAANVTDAISINGVGDTAIVRAGALDDAATDFAVGATMRVRRVRAAGTAACIFYVDYIRVA